MDLAQLKLGVRVRYLDTNGLEVHRALARAAGLVAGDEYVVRSYRIERFMSYLRLAGCEGEHNAVMFEVAP